MQVNRFVLQPDDEDAVEGDMSSDEFSFMTRLMLDPNAQIVGSGITGKGPVLWALIDPEAEVAERHFHVCGNRVDLPEAVGQKEYVGTAKIIGGPTFHVFELAPVAA